MVLAKWEIGGVVEGGSLKEVAFGFEMVASDSSNEIIYH